MRLLTTSGPWPASLIVSAVVCVGLTGCLGGRVLPGVGQKEGAQTAPDGSATQPLADGSNGHLPPASACTSQAPPPQVVRRLTRVEINNSLQDLLADPQAPNSATLFGGDATRYGFENVAEVLSVSDNAAFEMTLFAEQVGAYASLHAATLWPGCQVADANCLGAFVEGFGARAFRRPVTAEEKAALIALAPPGGDFAASLGTLVAAMVQFPGFLYRTELGVAGANGRFVLTPYETASWLSYTYTASMPDAQLLAAAAADALKTQAQLGAQARRLLALPRARAATESFFAQWLQSSQLLLTVRSEGDAVLDAATKADMQAETRAFVDDVVFDNPGSVHELYGRDRGTVTGPLASFYGAGTGAGPFVPSSVGRAPGVLGQGAVLAVAAQPTYASPTLRGRMVRMRLLCGSVPVPPVGVPPLVASAGNVTLRQRVTEHATNRTCAACHDQMDPLGFALGNFDTLGRVRTGSLENGQPVDVSATVVANLGGSTSSAQVDGAAGLAAYLADSSVAQDCLVRHWAMYSFGHVTWAEDACTFNAAAALTQGQDTTVASLLLSLTQVPNFLLRSPAAG